LYHLITDVSFVYKTWNDIGCFNIELDMLKFSINMICLFT